MAKKTVGQKAKETTLRNLRDELEQAKAHYAQALQRADAKAQGLETQVRLLQEKLGQMNTAFDKIQGNREVERNEYEEQSSKLLQELQIERKVTHATAERNGVLRAQCDDYKREIDKLLREQVDLRNQLHARPPRVQPYNGPWPGDSGDVVDLERKLDALLGKDATKLLRQSLDVERRWSGRHA